MNNNFVYEKIKDLIGLINNIKSELKSYSAKNDDNSKEISSLKTNLDNVIKLTDELKKIDYKSEIADISANLVKKMNMYTIKDNYWYFNDKKICKAVGENGQDGKNGKDGLNGANGKDGRDGKDGRNGLDGKNGKDGKDGKDGYTPIKGVDYNDGKDGELANIEIGEVSTLNPGEDAIVEVVKKNKKYKLNFGIPRGVSGRGSNATINGYNTVEIKQGSNITLTQNENVLTIDANSQDLTPYYKTDQATPQTIRGTVKVENNECCLIEAERINGEFDFVKYKRLAGTWTDITDEAKTTRGTASGDVLDVIGDTFVIGKTDKFNSIYIDVGTARSATGTFVWEYSLGNDTWATLTCTDGTNALLNDGTITFESPSDWATDSQDSSAPLYFVRLRADTGTFTTEPTVYLVIPEVGEDALNIYAHKGDATAAINIDANGYVNLRNVNTFSLLGTLSASVSGSTGTFSTSASVARTSLGFVSTDGLIESSSTASTSTAPINISPRTRMTAQGWDTGLNANTSQNWKNEVIPIYGNPCTSKYIWEYGYNGVSDTDFKQIAMLESEGNFVVLGSSYGNECLSNGTLSSPYTGWSVTNGFTLSSSRANYAHNVSGGTLTQVSGSLATALKKDTWYRLTYTTSSVVSGCLAYLDTDIAYKRIYLPGISATSGTYDVVFKTNSNPSDFIIHASSTAGSFILDTLSLKEKTGGLIEATGAITANDFVASDGSVGATGSFTSQDGKTVTVKNGLITGIV